MRFLLKILFAPILMINFYLRVLRKASDSQHYASLISIIIFNVFSYRLAESVILPESIQAYRIY